MGLRDFARSLLPGNDRQLAADIALQRRQGHHRSIAKAAATAEKWERKDRARDRRGDRQTDWRR